MSIHSCTQISEAILKHFDQIKEKKLQSKKKVFVINLNFREKETMFYENR
jgi:hypothetical protein